MIAPYPQEMSRKEGMNLNEFFELIERDPIQAPEKIGRVVKPSFMGACKTCGERRWWCEHELGDGE